MCKIAVLFMILLFNSGLRFQNETKQDKTVSAFSNTQEFLDQNKDKLKSNYFKYFEKVKTEVGELDFSIIDSTVIQDDELKVFGLKISAMGDPSWSYCEKLVVVTNSGKVLFESDFRQIDTEYNMAECGVPSYNLESLNIKSIGKNKYIIPEIREYYHPCAGQDLNDTHTSYFYDYESMNKIDFVETYYKHVEYLEDYTQDVLERITHLKFKEDEIVIETITNKFNLDISKDTRKFVPGRNK